MKRLGLLLALVMLFGACWDSSSDSDDADTVTELSLNRRVEGHIAAAGEVDWYHYRVVEANNILKITCTGSHMRPEIDALVTVYEEDDAGNKIRLYAEHAMEDSELPTDITIYVYIDRPKDIYIAVRDLMDDEASSQPYYLTIDNQNPAEGNESFAQSIPLVVDDATSCQTDNIGSIGDLDCFQFDTSNSGIYAVKVNFSPFAGGTDVDLGIELYDGDGTLLDTLTSGQGNFYQMLPRLDQGRHYIVVKDQGHNDFDSASHYEVCVESVAVDEVYTNDTAAAASEMTYDSSARAFSAVGSIAYADDEDWYRLPIGSLDTVGLKVINVSFDDAGDETLVFNYQLDLQDASDNSLLSRSFISGSSTYLTQIMAGTGDHLLVVKTAQDQKNTEPAPYTVSIEVQDIYDLPEVQGDGNNTHGAADVLTSGVATTGKIAFRGDEDWYRIDVDTSTPKVLEIFLDTANAGRIEHYLSLMRDSVVKKIHDADGADGPTELKTSVWIPQSTTAPHSATYLIKISDYQNDEGDDESYSLQANILDIPGTVPDGPAVTPAYYDEISERNGSDFVEVELESTSLVQAKFNANTALLDFRNGGAGITHSANPDGTTTISFPWIAGYIDYQGDQDWFQIPIQSLDPNLPDDQWYYDVEVRLASGAATDIEYVWKCYRDRNDNNFLVDRPTENDGYIGFAGDQDPIDNGILDIDTQTLKEDLWVGDGWQGTFYFVVSDFNYVRLPDTYALNPRPDDDWGYSPAYYFKLTLVYHPGQSRPE
jgi:hypothetical protein